MPDNVARSIMGAHGEGKKQHADFVEHRLQSAAVAFHAPIKMNQINLPGNRHKTRNKASMWTAPRKTCTYQGQLYMTMHVREENSDRLFEVENADSPPSLSKHDVLRSGLKSDLLSYLEVDCPSDCDEAGAKLIAGAHIVHYFRPVPSIKSFRDYADKKVIPYIERQFADPKRVDVIWDRYLPDSLKATTRQRRGAGIRQRMPYDGNGKFPRNWNSYLQNASNKVELFHYLSVAIAETVFCEGKVVMSTLDEDVLGSSVLGADESEYPLRPCNHELFDTRVMLHAVNAVSHCNKRSLIIANDTDILVLGISFFSDIGADKLWVSFGIANILRNIPIHDIRQGKSCSRIPSPEQIR